MRRAESIETLDGSRHATGHRSLARGIARATTVGSSQASLDPSCVRHRNERRSPTGQEYLDDEEHCIVPNHDSRGVIPAFCAVVLSAVIDRRMVARNIKTHVVQGNRARPFIRSGNRTARERLNSRGLFGKRSFFSGEICRDRGQGTQPRSDRRPDTPSGPNPHVSGIQYPADQSIVPHQSQ